MDDTEIIPDWDGNLCILDTARRLCGPATEAIILDKLGGSVIRVPGRNFENSVLARAVGAEATKAIASELGGVQFSIPIAHRRADRVLKMSLEGKRVRDIARALGCTERHVSHIRASLRDAGRLPHSKQSQGK